METVYLEVLLMPNGELLHWGKSIGFVSNDDSKTDWDFIDDGYIGGGVIKKIKK